LSCQGIKPNSGMMADQRYQIRDGQGNPITVNVRHDRRLTKTSRWERLPDGSLLLRVPHRLPKHRIGNLLEQITGQIDKISASYSRRNDESLSERAKLINKKYFHGELKWNAIRWVGNMHSRLGSCTQGGPTDGQIRISDKIKDWPEWVVDYVIAHELLHRKHPHHSSAFWSELKAAYPLSERAFGFISGVNFASGKPMVDEDEAGSPDVAHTELPGDEPTAGT
jgi:predicted metal-dependent hydrolase